MTPKEKALELVNRLHKYTWNGEDNLDNKNAKQCALIAVDDILNHHSQEQGLYRIDTYFWQEVKQELNKQD